MDDREDRVREKAYHLWLSEGQPHGRELDHWDLAREIIAIEDSQMDATRPVEFEHPGEPSEPIEALTNLGEFPTLTDQGEMQIPEEPAAAEPEVKPKKSKLSLFSR